MNEKRKKQLLFLVIFFCLLLAAFVAIKIYQSGARESEETD